MKERPAPAATVVDWFLRTLEALPPGTLYAAVFVLAALENVFPHPPADVGIALAAYLAGQRVLEAKYVVGLAWAGNVLAAGVVYLLARRYGRVPFRGAWGRKVLSEAAITRIEAAFQRHGTYGIFLTRLLPGWRGFVPPAAAIVGLSPGRTLAPIACAAALWYGALVYLVATFGTNLANVRHVLAHVNGILVILAVLLLALLAVVIVQRFRHRSHQP